MSKTVLITGTNGQVGWELVEQAKAQNLTVIGLNKEQCDIGCQQQVDQCVQTHSPDIIINAAAYTAVDKAETEHQQAYQINANGVSYLAQAANKLQIPLLHISTDYVFDGSKQQPYQENDKTNPQSVYGASKLEGEKLLKKALEQHIILRTSWVFGIHGHNFVKTMLKLGKEKEQLSIIDDQIGRPTFAADIAKVLLTITQRYLEGSPIPWGTYHFGGNPACSWYQFAEEIFLQAKNNITSPQLTPIPTSQFPQKAKRPFNSVLNVEKLTNVLAITNSWKLGVEQLITNDQITNDQK